MSKKHLGGNPLGGTSAAAELAREVAGSAAQSEVSEDKSAHERKRKSSRTAARRTFTTELPMKAKKSSTRRKNGHHIAGAPGAMDENLREEFRGALRTSLSTSVEAVDENRVAALELRLAAMENTGTLANRESLAGIYERLQSTEVEMKEAASRKDLGQIEARLEDLIEEGAAAARVSIETRLSEIDTIAVRLDRLEIARKDLLRRESLSTIEARILQLETSIEMRLECLEANERELARQASVNSLAARSEVIESRVARIEVASKSHVTEHDFSKLAERVEEIRLDSSEAIEQEQIAHLTHRIEYLEEGSEDERMIIEGRLSVLEATFGSARDRDEELTLLCEELKLQASELEEARRFAHTARKKLADLEGEISSLRSGREGLDGMAGRTQTLADAVNHLKEEEATRDSTQALLWTVAIGALVVSAFQLLIGTLI